MAKKKSAAQLDREIAEALAQTAANPDLFQAIYQKQNAAGRAWMIRALKKHLSSAKSGSHHAVKKSGGPSKKTKTIDGYKITIWEQRALGEPRFAAYYYDALPPSVVGRGETAAEAIADLKRAADTYSKQRQDEIEREDWAQHEAEKEEALRRGDY